MLVSNSWSHINKRYVMHTETAILQTDINITWTRAKQCINFRATIALNVTQWGISNSPTVIGIGPWNINHTSKIFIDTFLAEIYHSLPMLHALFTQCGEVGVFHNINVNGINMVLGNRQYAFTVKTQRQYLSNKGECTFAIICNFGLFTLTAFIICATQMRETHTLI